MVSVGDMDGDGKRPSGSMLSPQGGGRGSMLPVGYSNRNSQNRKVKSINSISRTCIVGDRALWGGASGLGRVLLERPSIGVKSNDVNEVLG